MAVKLRLKRMGAKKRPFYRVVAADSRSPRDGKIIEVVGTYNPITEPAEVKIDEELALKWLQNGANPTDTVRDLFSKEGIMEKYHNLKNPKNENKAPKVKAQKSISKDKATKKEATKTVKKVTKEAK